VGLKRIVPNSGLVTQQLINLDKPEWVPCPSFTKEALMFPIRATAVEKMPTCYRTKTQFHVRMLWSKCEE